jgi:hypothetical protein
VAAHWPPVSLPTCPYADIPARFCRLPTMLGTEGVCNPSVFCVPSVRRRRQESGEDIVADFGITGLETSEKGGFFRQQPGRPLRNSEGPLRN